ncbi:hypothetical protein KI387_003220 [Taxus chinensis]|uniref:RING-type domain-containing protein n=1 Tax=Taxus chinensis TaxID=29808 RepID=A0AA38H0K0_TAXCH|nr:hypothetical protein KI387_003220 [Taxus chinensis]
MYQWRKFQYFEEKPTGSYVAEELKENVECCSSGRGRMVAGSGDGMVHVLDRGLKLNFNFQAHSTSVRFIQQLKQRNMLVTVGEDEATSPQLSAMSLKVFDLDKMEPEGSSTTGPTCIQILRIFTNQFPEAKITSFLVFEEAPPILTISIGLETDQRTDRNIFTIYDLKNRLIAYSLSVGVVSHMLCEWGNIVLLTSDHKVFCIGEKDMEGKLDMLYKKNLYTIAINLVQSQQADAAATAEVLRKYGDHLYGKQDYDEAMSQYIRTIGQLEPSYVIQKFLDAQRIYNLTSYLEKLHEKGLASKDHTALLLNCYTKLKDVAKLDEFIEGEGEHRFDVETAVNYDEALEYISSLESIQAAVTVKEYGKILVEHKSDETIAILMKLCSGDDDLATDSTSVNLFPGKLPSPMDFVNVFIDHPLYLMNFLERYISKVKDSPAHVEIHNTLLELYLSDDLCTSSLSKSNVQGVDTSGRGPNKNVSSLSNIGNKGKRIIENGQVHMGTDERPERLNKGLALLKSAWPPHEDHPCYDVDLAVVLCEMYQFKQGGGDPSLWEDVLKYFGELGEDCSKEVKEVLVYIERDDLLPSIIVLQILAKNPCLTLSVVKDYVARKLEQESKLVEENRKSIDKYQEETAAMRKEVQELRTNARIFQLSKCTGCTFTLDLPAVHFMCMHSFHQRCLGDNEKECPVCAPQNKTLLEMKRSLEQNAKDHD